MSTQIPDGTYDTLIILGNPAKDDGRPSAILKTRLDRGLELYKSGVAPLIIVSGGAAHNFYIEAEVMHDYLVANGIPTSKIIQDQISLSTIDNAENCSKLMAMYGLETALLVTSSFHAPRAKLLFEKQDINIDTTCGGESLIFRIITLPLYPIEWLLRLIIDKRNPYL